MEQQQTLYPTQERMIRSTPLDAQACRARVSSEWWSSKVLEDVETGCVAWTGAKDFKGYGKVRVDGRGRMAHRVALVAANGRDIPPGLTVDHLCRNRACVNPDHLEIVTHRTNVLRSDSWQARNLAKTECPQGHALTVGNLVESEARKGHRVCRTCARARSTQKARLVRAAARALGVSTSEYVATHGQGRENALRAIEEALA